jgi:hypothetical protein
MDKTLRKLVRIAAENGNLPFAIHDDLYYNAVQVLVRDGFIGRWVMVDIDEKGHGINMRYKINESRLAEMLIKYG